MVMTAPVADWEEWTGMRFPGDGEHLFPGCLAPLVVQDGVGHARRAERLAEASGLGGKAHELAVALDEAVAKQ